MTFVARKDEKVLPPVHANAGIAVLYKRKIERMVRQMNRSVTYFLRAAYNANEPRVVKLAQDELPSVALRRAIRELAKRWDKRFDEAAEDLARYFAKKATLRTDKQLENILRTAGISVKFQMTRAQQDIFRATVIENVSLIKSIPSEYFPKVEGLVMRSVQVGGDLEKLIAGLMKLNGHNMVRARTIARDQNRKATSALHRARQLELNIEEAIWLHSHGGKKPRKRHLAYHGKRYKVAKGAPVGDKPPGSFVQPGFEINCRCVSRSVIPLVKKAS